MIDLHTMQNIFVCAKHFDSDDTLPGRKYSSTTKYPCTDCAMYRLNIQLGPKMGVETCRSQKFVVFALTLEKFF